MQLSHVKSGGSLCPHVNLTTADDIFSSFCGGSFRFNDG
jgi:hypothetical protein